MQLIDANELEKRGWTMHRTVVVNPQTMEMQVKKPTDFPAIIDAVPVVRCKDCKHRDAEDGFCKGRGWPMQLVPDDGFCDKGERSEG